ncbi:MAG: hypothetical protein RL641_350 [Candidatus Parcubacteria bacterium]|jgi:cytochrome b involved in lipid metabolism
MQRLKSNIIFLCCGMIAVFGIVVATGGQGNEVPRAQVEINNESADSQEPPMTTIAGQNFVAPTTTAKGFSVADVATHKTKSDCWSIVRGNVYDLTSWISQHPGGSGPIVGMCGIDATEAFVDQHGGKSNPEAELASFKIGIVKQ